MPFKYQSVVPWGRSYDEYRRMFSLTDKDVKKRIIGCGDGPAAFNAVCNMNGGNVVSVDPIYSMTKQQIRERLNDTYENVLSQTRDNMEKFIWKTIGSVEELGEIRMSAMNQFLASYEKGKKSGWYVPCAMPVLPFCDGRFDLALSSHFLFLYTDNLSYEFHIASIHEMMRVAGEARIFPLLNVNAEHSPYVDEMMNDNLPYRIELKNVDYEFQVGGNRMMVITR